MKRSIAVVVGFVAALPGCADLTPRGRDLPAEVDHETLAPVQLGGEVLGEGTELGLPFPFRVVGEHVVIADRASDAVIKVLDRHDGTLVRSFGRQGAGPGEYEGIWSLATVPGAADEFWIWDVGLRRLTHVDLGDDFAGGGEPGDRSVNVMTEVPVLDPVLMGDRWVTLGFLETGRLAYFTGGGELMQTVGALPPGDDDLPAAVRQQVNQSYLAAKPDRSLLAVATRHFDRLEIYRPDGTMVVRKVGPFGIEPTYEVRIRDDNAGMATGSDLRFGYVGLAATDERIYALFSGRTRAGFPGEANFGEYVHVYDWDANLLGVLELDAAAISLDVDPENRTLYTLRHNPTPAVMRYSLEGLFGGERPGGSVAGAGP